MIELDTNEIHIWDIPLQSACRSAAIEAVLSPDERYRASRYRLAGPRLQFVTARAKLRQILGQYLEIAPSSLRFSYGAQGKPTLLGATSLSFNLAHSGQRVLIAVARSRQIGIDLELVRPLPDLMDIAQRFFTAEEAADLISLGNHERELAFYKCWTRKEAFIKCTGDGLSAPLNSFQVTLYPNDTARIVKVNGCEDPACHWTLVDLSSDSEYAAAVVYSGPQANIHLFLDSPQEI